MTTEPWGLHWFRRDLRLTGNPALIANWQRHPGRVLGFFCFDPLFLSRPDFSADRFGFFLQTMAALRKDLRDRGGDLLVLEGRPREAFGRLVAELDRLGIPRPQTVTWNRDYEPFARRRDDEMEVMWKEQGSAVVTTADHLLAEPHEIAPASSGTKGFFSVYTPFSRRWFEFLQSPQGQERVRVQEAAFKVTQPPRFTLTWTDLWRSHGGPQGGLEDRLDHTLTTAMPLVRVPLPPAGHAAAVECLHKFKAKIQRYADDRDFPERKGTSGLSIYLKNGSITSRQVLALLKPSTPDLDKKSGVGTWLREIAWREFYYHILFHRPDVEGHAFLEKYQALPWENSTDLFERWKTGTTGFPIVDAAMRELRQTGLMHNRCRMIVASFLTKDLLIDWRWGERYFMTALLDGDLAPNNGGWQWAASTGCDPQPYFRIFNPELQSRKFDPDGSYIARYVPELKPLVGTSSIHAPSAEFARRHYVEPIVSHSVQRNKAMALFKVKDAKGETPSE